MDSAFLFPSFLPPFFLDPVFCRKPSLYNYPENRFSPDRYLPSGLKMKH